MEWSKDSWEFDYVFCQWTDVHNLLCGFQYHEIFDEQLEFVIKDRSDNQKKCLVNRARDICNTYKLVKFGWAELVGSGYFCDENPLRPADYNELFLRIIYDRCKLSVLKRRDTKPDDQSDWTKLRLAQSLEDPHDIDTEVALEENIKGLRKFTGEQVDDTYYALYDLTISAGCQHITEILENSSNPFVREALEELELLTKEARAACLKKLRKKVDKKPSCKNLNSV
jgi:hypothetical protein